MTHHLVSYSSLYETEPVDSQILEESKSMQIETVISYIGRRKCTNYGEPSFSGLDIISRSCSVSITSSQGSPNQISENTKTYTLPDDKVMRVSSSSFFVPHIETGTALPLEDDLLDAGLGALMKIVFFNHILKLDSSNSKNPGPFSYNQQRGWL